TIRHRIDDEERGLRELRQTEFGSRIVNAQLADRIAEDLVGLRGPVAKAIEQRTAHPLRLRSLTWKKTCCGHKGNESWKRDILSQCRRPRQASIPCGAVASAHTSATRRRLPAIPRALRVRCRG